MWRLRRPARHRPPAEEPGARVSPPAVPAADPDRAPGEQTPDSDIAALIADVRDLRLALSADLSLAAGAVENGADDIAAEVLDGGRDDVARFRARALARLVAADSCGHGEPQPAARPGLVRRAMSSRLLPAAPVLAAAAAAAAFAAGVLPVPTTAGPGTAAVHARAVADSWQAFSRAATGRVDEADLLRAAANLHRSLASLIDAAPHDPEKGQQALLLLQMERALLLNDQPPGATQVLAQADDLVARLAKLLPALPRAGDHPNAGRQPARQDQQQLDGPQPAAGADGQAATSPSPTASPSPSPSPSPSSSPEPTASPSQQPPPTLGPLPSPSGGFAQ